MYSSNTKIQPYGSVEITAIDQITGAKRTVSDRNVSISFLYNLDGNTPRTDFDLRLYTDKIAKNARVVRLQGNTILFDTRKDVNYAPLSGRDVEDWYYEETFLFNAPGVDRNIEGVLMTTSTTSATTVEVSSRIALDNTFVQGGTELLSIRYRYIVNTSGMGERNAYRVSHLFYNLFASYEALQIGAYRGYVSDDYLDRVTFPPSVDGEVGKYANNQRVSYFNYSWDKPDNIGAYIGQTGVINHGRSTTGAFNGPVVASLTPVVTPEDHDLVPNYPMGPLFNHNALATHNFEDLDHLATGTGYPVISSVSAPSFNVPEFELEGVRINITKTGETGVARYELAEEPISREGLSVTGFTPLDYSFYNGSISRGSATIYPEEISEHIALKDPETQPLRFPLKMYNSDWVICTHFYNSKLSIALRNLHDSSLVYGFDALTAPSLPTNTAVELYQTKIRRNEAGDIFYISSDGYVVIRNPLGAASVESVLLSDIGLSAVISAMDVNGDLIQLVTTAEMAYSLDGGTSWTVHATTQFNDAYNTIVGGDVTNPSLLLVGNLTSPYIGWFSGATNTMTALKAGIAPGSVEGYFNPVEGFWYVMAQERNNKRVAPLILRTLETVDTLNYFDATQTNTAASTTFSYTRLMPLKQGGYAMLRAASSSGRITMYTADGIICSPPASYSSTIDPYYPMRYSMEFRRDIYDAADGVSETSPGKWAYVDNTLRRIGFFQPGTHRGEPSHQDSPVFNSLAFYGKIYRWDTTEGAWKKGYNAPQSATADGSSTLPAIRSGFDTDANRFNLGSRLDISAAVNSADYSVNGFTFLATATEESKNVGTAPADWRSGATPAENPTAAIMELTDDTTLQSIALMHCGYNNSLTLIDYTDTGTNNFTEHTLGVTPGTSTARYALTLSADGTTVTVYMNGAAQGAPVTLNAPFPMTANYQVSVGIRNLGVNRIPYHGSGFRGSITNVVVYDTVLTAGEVVSDNGLPSGLSKTTDVVVRYECTEDYFEGKLTDAAPTETVNGLTISFPPGDLVSDAYVEGDDYYSVKATKGFIKDNASVVTFAQQWGLECHSVNAVTSPIDGTNVLPVSDSLVTDLPVIFGGRLNYHHRVGCPTDISTNQMNPAQTVVLGDSEYIFETVTAFGEIEIVFGSKTVWFLYQTSPPSTTPYIRIANNGDVTVCGGTPVPTVRGIRDKYKINLDRTNETIALSKWDGAQWVLLGQPESTAGYSAYTSDARLYFLSDATNYEARVDNVTATGILPANIMYIGDRDTGTGAYSTTFKGLYGGAAILPYVTVAVDGVPQTLLDKGSYESTTYTSGDSLVDASIYPAVGSVHIYREAGILVFNPSEAGKTITVAGFTVSDSGSLDD